MVDIQPVSDFLIVQVLEDDPSPELIFRPFGTADTPKYAKVIAAGPGMMLANGQPAPMPCKVGDTVVLQINAGTEVKLGRETYRIVPARDLFGVVSPAFAFQLHSSVPA